MAETYWANDFKYRGYRFFISCGGASVLLQDGSSFTAIHRSIKLPKDEPSKEQLHRIADQVLAQMQLHPGAKVTV